MQIGGDAYGNKIFSLQGCRHAGIASRCCAGGNPGAAAGAGVPRPAVSMRVNRSGKMVPAMPGAAPPATAVRPPAIGEVRNGHRYIGGDPANPASWIGTGLR